MFFYVLFTLTLLLSLSNPLSFKQTSGGTAAVSFNIGVKTFGDEKKAPFISKKAHSLESLLIFLGFESGAFNFTDVADELSKIPHNISVDLTLASKDARAWIENHTTTATQLNHGDDESKSESECLDHIPTYLFKFDREDILDEFGSEYFLLRPSSELVSSKNKDKLLTRSNHRKEEHKISYGENSHSKIWLHIPKTGSSFEPTAVNLGYDIVTHEPCPAHDACEMITLLREPYQRLISWYYFAQPEFEKCKVKSMSSYSVNRFKQAIQKCFNAYLMENIYDGSETNTLFWGCQAKMLLGYHCDDGQIPSRYYKGNELAKAALLKMRDSSIFKFIGNVDFFDASVTLIHQMLGGQLALSDGFSRVNTRSNFKKIRPDTFTGNSELDQIPLHDSDFLCENNPLCKNVPDEMVYQEMKKMMILNILFYHQKPVKIFQNIIYEINNKGERVNNLDNKDISCQKSAEIEATEFYVYG